MRTLKRISVMLFPALMLLSCSEKKQSTADVKEDDFLFQYIDTTVKPGDDFFKYATGNWMKNNPIPESERRWGIANLVRNDIYEKLRNLSDEAAGNTKAEKGSNAQRIGDFWSTGMDSATIEKLGVTPLNAQFAMIDAIKTKADLMKVIGEFQIYAGSPLYSNAIYQDEMNSEKYALHFYQGGIGLPERDYYFNTDARTENIRKEYKEHLKKMFMLLGDDEKTATANSAVVYKIEYDLAKASRKLEDLRDPYANYNKMSIGDFSKLTPSINWSELLTQMNIKGVDTVIVGQPEFYKQVEKSLNTVSIADWKTYMRWNLINGFAGELSSAFDQQNYHFYGSILTGTKAQRPRWKRILDAEEGFIGDALGQLYVEKFVSPTMRQRYDKLTQNMMDEYKNHINNLEWMSKPTKEKAVAKLAKISRKVCYPDKWKDYSSMNLDRSSYAMNVLKCRTWQYNYYVDKLNKPVDRTEWEMTPQTYNAYYNPSNNEIVLPAAQFLIPGLPDSLADDAIIYGYAAASTIGHELTHGFDDEGRQFDPNGNLSNWWTAEDSLNFSKRAKILEEQFSSYVVLDSLHVNGKASLGENIADLGGLVIGLDAFKKTEQYKKGEKIDGLTPVQRYFLGYTLGWLGHARDASLAMQVMTDVHAPNFLRVNGPLSDMPEFYEAFGIKEGDKMWRPDSLRVKIW
ncbi:MAG: M13 family metallopeptidase [Bacteroidetes bacterium]|nr:M13 family metallopeptidase [Bacteroidota bacterium]